MILIALVYSLLNITSEMCSEKGWCYMRADCSSKGDGYDYSPNVWLYQHIWYWCDALCCSLCLVDGTDVLVLVQIRNYIILDRIWWDVEVHPWWVDMMMSQVISQLGFHLTEANDTWSQAEGTPMRQRRKFLSPAELPKAMHKPVVTWSCAALKLFLYMLLLSSCFRSLMAPGGFALIFA